MHVRLIAITSYLGGDHSRPDEASGPQGAEALIVLTNHHIVWGKLLSERPHQNECDKNDRACDTHGVSDHLHSDIRATSEGETNLLS